MSGDIKEMPQPTGHTIDQDISLEVDRVLDEGNVLKYIADAVRRTVIGNRLAIELLILVCIQRALSNGKGVYVILNGESGGGKSYTVRQVLFYFPPEFVCDASMSAMAIFYDYKGYPRIYYVDDFNSSNPDVKSTIKNVLTNFRRETKHLSVKKNGSSNMGVEMKVPARTVIIFSCVDSIDDLQVMNRLIPLPVDNDPVTKQQIHEFQKKVASGETEDLDAVIDKKVLVCQELLRILTDKLQYVTIPYANEIVWNKEEMGNTRNFDVFLDLIRLSAILEQRQRETDANGHLIANYEDFHTAVRIYAPRRAMQASKLSEGPQKLLNYLRANCLTDFTQGELVEHFNTSQANVSRWLSTLQEMSTVAEETSAREIELKDEKGQLKKDNDGNYVTRTTTLKVYKYRGEPVKSSIEDTPLTLSEKEKARPEYTEYYKKKTGELMA